MRIGASQSTMQPGNLQSVDSQRQITLAAAAKYKVSAQMLWGIYGTETTFGANTATSSAGAQGPMQFIPSTWAQYGGGQSVTSFAAAMPAAAHYLHDLGANEDLSSSKTIAAVNAYNGNGGGTNPNTSYYQNVVKNAAQLGVSGKNAVQQGGGTTDSSSGGGGGPSLSDLFTGGIDGLAVAIGTALVTIVKDMAIGFFDMIIVPAWHRNQNMVWWYTYNVLFPSSTSTGGYVAWKTWPTNAAFWGFGYVLLFTDSNAGTLKPAAVRQTRLARHTRAAQSLPARHALVKPKLVKEKTPKKPKESASKVKVEQVGTVATYRARRVKVHGTPTTTQATQNVRMDNGGSAQRPARERTGRREAAPQPIVSEVNVREVAVEKPSDKVRKAAESHASHTGGGRSPKDRRVSAQVRAAASRHNGNETRYRPATRPGDRGR